MTYDQMWQNKPDQKVETLSVRQEISTDHPDFPELQQWLTDHCALAGNLKQIPGSLVIQSKDTPLVKEEWSGEIEIIHLDGSDIMWNRLFEKDCSILRVCHYPDLDRLVMTAVEWNKSNGTNQKQTGDNKLKTTDISDE